MQKLCNVYEVTNRQGEVVARGFSDDVAMVIGCTSANVNYLAKYQGLYKHKFKVEIIGQRVKHYGQENDYEDLITIEKETFIERYHTLEQYRNTILSKKEYRRHRELIEAKGYKGRYRRVNCKNGEWYYIVSV